MYKCLDCGRLLDDDELTTTKEYVSDYKGGSYISSTGCSCGGDVEEAFACKGCDDYFTQDELHDGFCENCISQYATLDNAIGCGTWNKDDVSINSFLHHMFPSWEIEEILIKELHKREAEGEGSEIAEMAKDYCLDDIDWFSAWLQKENKI